MDHPLLGRRDLIVLRKGPSWGRGSYSNHAALNRLKQRGVCFFLPILWKRHAREKHIVRKAECNCIGFLRYWSRLLQAQTFSCGSRQLESEEAMP